MAGWHDFFIKGGLESYERASQLQPNCRLTVGCHGHWGLLLLPNLQILYRSLLKSLDAHMPAHSVEPPCPRKLPRLRSFSRREIKPAAHSPFSALTSLFCRHSAREDSCAQAVDKEIDLPVQIRFLGSMR
ncbi:MAG: hypothetical protein SGPRY_010754 [Prymnesium sp.]